MYQYIYIYENCIAFFGFERQTNEVRSGAVFLCYSIFWSEAFAGEALVLGEISFFILLSSVWTLDIVSLLTLKTYIFREDSPGNKHSS